MGAKIYVAGTALMQFRYGDLCHILPVSVPGLLPGIELVLVAGLADQGGRDRFRRLEGFDGRGQPHAGASDNDKGKDEEHHNDLFHDVPPDAQDGDA
jgi:hypothetical protein